MWYKFQEGELFRGIEIVNADYRITSETPRDQVIDGWRYFDTEEQARAFYGLPEKPKEDKFNPFELL